MLHLKLVNASDKDQELVMDVTGARDGPAAMNSLHAATWWDTNTINKPDAIKPIPLKVTVTSKNWRHNLAGNTIEVIDIPLQ